MLPERILACLILAGSLSGLLCLWRSLRLWGWLPQPALLWLWKWLLQSARLWGRQLQSARLRGQLSHPALPPIL